MILPPKSQICHHYIVSNITMSSTSLSPIRWLILVYVKSLAMNCNNVAANKNDLTMIEPLELNPV